MSQSQTLFEKFLHFGLKVCTVGAKYILIFLHIQSDGKVLAGGAFTTFTGSSQIRLIRLNSDGSKDTSFDIGTGFGGGGNSNLSIGIQ